MATDVLPTTAATRSVLVLEALFPVVAGQAYIWLAPYDRPRWLDVVFGGLVAIVAAAYVVRRGILSWRAFGLAWGPDHRRAALPIGLFTLGAIGVLLLWGWQSPRGLRQDWDLVGAMAAYPIWGFIQQGLMFGVVYPRLRLVAGPGWGVLLTAAVFAGAHLPNPLLMVGGAGMVFVYGLVWQRAPSLPVVAISHGLIGAVSDKALHVSMRVGAHYFAS